MPASVGCLQCDPEWCGGLSELLKICALVKEYEGVRLIPHGHHVLAAAHVVASQPEALCPMVEYGEGWMPSRQSLQTRSVSTASVSSLKFDHKPLSWLESKRNPDRRRQCTDENSSKRAGSGSLRRRS